MDEYALVTLVGHAGETETAFKSRLTTFWTHLLRSDPTLYEHVYAEATAFDEDGDAVTREYMVAVPGIEMLTAALKAAGVEHRPVDRDDTYSKYEASGAGWFQLDH